MRAWIGWLLAAVALAGANPAAAEAKELGRPAELKAAFIRGGDVWMKEGRQERKIADHPEAIREVAWSSDGTWLAYETKEPTYEMWVYDVKQRKETEVCTGCDGFRWAHRKTALAFHEDGAVYTVQLQEGQRVFGRPVRRARSVGQFGWLPDDRGILVSSLPYRKAGEWQPLTLSVVRFDGPADAQSVESPLFTLPKPSADFFAVSLGPFRWSPDGKWVAFVAEPTASWSMDSNTLCLLSADGSRFFAIGKMLAREDWYGWAPGKHRIGYIDGEGRFEISNKRFAYRDAPSAGALSFTPPGMMDLGFAWLRPDAVVVPRTPELSWDEGPVPNATPALYAVDLRNGRAKRLTFPPEGSGDFSPTYVAAAKRLTWLRSAGPQRRSSDVWTSTARGADASVFIRNVDAPPVWSER